MDSNFKIGVICWTYNQSAYIKDTLGGFVMQRTEVPYVCCIVDDASTDGEVNILENFVSEQCSLIEGTPVIKSVQENCRILFAHHKQNNNCYFYIVLLNNNHHSIRKGKKLYIYEILKNTDYLAFCEGDDYWTNEKKLQEQYDFMKSHPNYSLCFHAHLNLYNNGEKQAKRRYQADKLDCPISEMIVEGGGYMGSCTMFFRTNDYFAEKPKWYISSPVGDYVLMLWLATHGKVYYSAKIMSTYRSMSNGSWNERVQKKWRFRKNYYDKSIETLKEFDSWSGGKFRHAVTNRINHLRRSRFVSLYYHPVKMMLMSFFKR